MKFKSLFFAALAAVFSFASCDKEGGQNLGTEISISVNEMAFEIAGGEQELTVTATRNWWVETDADWVVVSPESGVGSAEPQTVTVTALANTGMDRTADLKFTIGMKSKYLTVSQAGPGGSPEALIVYFNDFDKEDAEKTYGSGNSWPYLNQFEGWKNATGTGAENVDYEFNGMSARANSTSDSSYSDYAGSGKNNMFFGSSAYLLTKNIALNGATDLTLTFGTEKYSEDNGSVFTNSEYKIYLSNDGTKWVELTDYTFAGGTTPGRWNIATANFSVPEGTETLSICMQVTVASSYRMDDMKLVISEGGAAVDFSAGVEMDFATGNTGGGNNGGGSSDATAIYSNNYDKSAAAKVGNNWPFLDESSVWKNAAGTGAENVTYVSSAASVRNNSNSDGTYSDYSGSGLNNIFFGSNAYFLTHNIALNGATTLTLTFGADKYVQNGNSTFSTSEFIVYISNDGNKWISLPYEFAGTADGRWNIATANFTVPAGTTNLSICMEATVASAYRLDDMKLVAGTVEGTVIDFTQGLEKDFNAGASGGGNEGGDDNGGTVTPPAEGVGQYDIYGVTWTLGTNAFDNTSTGTNTQSATVNGVSVSNLLKLGTGSKVGDATLHVAAGTSKIGFYCVAWKGKKAQVKLSTGGTEITTITPVANEGATGNPPYTALNVADSDYFEVELPAGTTDIKVETLDPSNGRVLFVGLQVK